MADIVLINPRFEMSFWGLEAALPFLGKRANLPVGALPLLAALTLPPHSITIIDENVEEIDYERCRRADIVGVTGMIVQRRRMRSVLVRLKGWVATPWSEGRGSASVKTILATSPTSSLLARRRKPGPNFSPTGAAARRRLATSRTRRPTCPRSRPRDSISSK